jgi:hypothetical protein
MNIVDFELYRRSRKRFPHTEDYANDNKPNWATTLPHLYLETGELLVPGERGQLVVVDSYKRCSCYDM